MISSQSIGCLRCGILPAVCQAEIKLMGLRKEIKKLSKWLCAEAPSLFTKAGCKALGELSNGRNDEGRSIEADQFAEVVVRRRRRYKAWLAKRRNSGLAEISKSKI